MTLTDIVVFECCGWSIGVLKVRDCGLSFVEQVGQVDRELDLASVKQVAAKGWTLSILSVTGEEFILSIMEP